MLIVLDFFFSVFLVLDFFFSVSSSRLFFFSRLLLFLSITSSSLDYFFFSRFLLLDFRLLLLLSTSPQARLVDGENGL